MTLEAQLLQTYTMIFRGMGMEGSQATDTAQTMISQAAQEVIQRGWNHQPPNLGDWLLQHERTDQNIHRDLEALRREGVRDQDVRWYWNLPPLERVMLEKADEMSRVALYIASIKQGSNADQAGDLVWKVHPKFGNPAEGHDDDRPLPIELKARINSFIERHSASPLVMRAKTDKASSFNALIRSEIRAGSV